MYKNSCPNCATRQIKHPDSEASGCICVLIPLTAYPVVIRSDGGNTLREAGQQSLFWLSNGIQRGPMPWGSQQVCSSGFGKIRKFTLVPDADEMRKGSPKRNPQALMNRQ
jgi:hypothetical protein